MMNIIFDLSFNGFQYGKMHAGIYRVSHEIYRRLIEQNHIQIAYSVFGYKHFPIVNSDVENYLNAYHFPIIDKANNRVRRKFLPFRKEKLFKLLYKKLGIEDYKISTYEKILSQSDVYYSVFYPIPKEIKNQKNIKKVITIHDVIPKFFNNIDESLMDDILQSIDENTTVISISENTKKDILFYAPHIKQENIIVCPLAASSDVFYPCNDAEKFKNIQAQYQLPEKYILSLSTIEPRKNIDHLIRCFIKTIVENQIDDLYLVLVGKKGWQYDKIFEEYENAKHLKNRIIFTGFVPDTDLASIYSHAQTFYYMSLYEGFGLPPLEAMQCGVPVVVSDNSSLPEVVGQAGILLNATDEKALCKTIEKLYNSGDLREEFSKKSLIQAQKFSWEKTINRYVDIFKQIKQ